jgi:hypothetical protein
MKVWQIGCCLLSRDGDMELTNDGSIVSTVAQE